MTDLNPRLHPYRDDLAASFLKDRVDAVRYVKGNRLQIQAPVAGLYRESVDDAALDTQAQMGEVFTVYDRRDGWAWGQLESDDYVGWIKADRLSEIHFSITHKISVLRSIVFSKPDLKTTPIGMLSLNAGVEVVDEKGDFSALSTGGWVYTAHLAKQAEFHTDFVSVAEMFLSAPYLWGGKDSFGLDCSGLVQSSMTAAGFSVPRDAGMQEPVIGQEIYDADTIPDLQRGDLVFWPGHVGIMQDAEKMLHANAHHMMCASEPLKEAIDRIGQTKTAVRSIKRPSGLFYSQS